MDIFEKGEDIPRTVTLYESQATYEAGGDPLDTSIFSTIEVVVFGRVHDVIGTYTLAGGTVTRLSPTSDGQIFFIIPSETTDDSKAMKYYYRIKTTESNVDYPNNIRTRYFLDWCFELRTTK